jgi:acetoin utilization protein AcuB
MRAMDVTELMSRSVIVTSPDASIADALRLLEDSGVRHLPVVDGTRVVGMLSDRDLREYRLPVLDALHQPRLADDLSARPVADAMNTVFVFVDHLESVAKAVEVMLEYGVGAVPVLHREGGELLGMVSYVDVLRFVQPML